MKRLALPAILLFVCAWPAYADVTVKMTTRAPAMRPAAPGGGGAVTAPDMPATYYIKGTRARIDTVVAGREMTTIVDFSTGQMVTLNRDTKEAIVYDLAKLGEQVRQTVQMGETKVSMKPTGQTKQILGQTCTEYLLSVSMQVRGPGGRRDMGPMTMTLEGPVWIAKDAPGTKDFETFYKAAASSGLFLAAAGRGGPGMGGDGIAAMYKALAEAGGIPYEQRLQAKMEGTGPAAAMTNSMGQPPEVVTMVTSVSTGTIRDDMFSIPEGYTKRVQ